MCKNSIYLRIRCAMPVHVQCPHSSTSVSAEPHLSMESQAYEMNSPRNLLVSLFLLLFENVEMFNNLNDINIFPLCIHKIRLK